VDIDQQDAGASAFVTVDRDHASSLGIPMTTIDNTLYDAFGQRQVASIYQGLNQYHVVMEADPLYSGKPEALNNLYLPVGGKIATSTSTTNANAALGSNAASGSAAAPAPPHRCRWPPWRMELGLHRRQRQPFRWRTFGHRLVQPAAGPSLGQAAQTIATTMAELHLPATVHGDFGGAKVFQQSTSSTPLLIVAALVTIYIVLGVLYESAIHPLTVLSTLPSAGVGAIFSLIVTGGSSISSR
jgi:multidrug efflux pump